MMEEMTMEKRTTEERMHDVERGALCRRCHHSPVEPWYFGFSLDCGCECHKWEESGR